MRGNELIKKVEALGKESGIAVRIDKKRGKGSHQTLYFGDRKTISQPEGRIEDWHLSCSAYAARHQREGLEMTAMNSARDLRIVWKF